MASQYGSREGKGGQFRVIPKRVKLIWTGMVHGIRSLGSAALDIAYVATGAVRPFLSLGPC